MLEVKLTSDFDDLFALEEVQVRERTCLFLCPNPNVADLIRSQLERRGLGQVEVLTIHKFIRDESTRLGLEANILSKAQMLMHLAFFWKTQKNNETFQQFYQAYSLFSELRSFNLNLDLMSEIFPYYDQTIIEGVQLFWRYLEVTDNCDEHAFYGKLTELMKASEQEFGHHLIFYGFDFVTGVQVDWLKALALQNKVIIPFSESVYQKTTEFDWVRWFAVDKREELKSRKAKALRLAKFPKGKLTYYTNNIERLAETEKLKFILATKSPTFAEVNEIGATPLFYKLSSDLFSAHLQGAFEKIKSKFYVDRDAVVDYTEILQTINEQLREELRKPVQKKKFRKIKIYDLMKRTVEEYAELSAQNEQLKYFDLEVIEHTCELDLPRTSTMPISTEFRGEIVGLSGITTVKDDERAIICASSQYSKLKGNDNFYCEEVMEFLSTIGPVKRKEFEFELLKSKLVSVLDQPNALLLIESGLTDHDIAWSEIVESFEKIEPVDLYYSADFSVKDDFLQGHVRKKERSDVKMSATRFQTYLDCPRRYYFQYVDPAKFFPELSLDIPPNERGELEHAIIGSYLESHQSYDEAVHRQLCEEKFENFLVINKKTVPRILYDSIFSELVQFSKNGIEELLRLKAIFTEIDFKFEKDLLPPYKGSCDLYFKLAHGKVGILDFKRSRGSIPSITDIRELKKIQLPFYVDGTGAKPLEVEILGYINLSDPSDSVIFCFDKAKTALLKDGKFCGGKVANLREDLGSLCQAYKEFYQEKFKELITQEVFPAKPLSDKSCSYCALKSICDKGVANGG